MKTLRNLMYAMTIFTIGCTQSPNENHFYNVRVLGGNDAMIVSAKGDPRKAAYMMVLHDSAEFNNDYHQYPVVDAYFYGTNSRIQSINKHPFNDMTPNRLEQIADSLLQKAEK